MQMKLLHIFCNIFAIKISSRKPSLERCAFPAPNFALQCSAFAKGVRILPNLISPKPFGEVSAVRSEIYERARHTF